MEFGRELATNSYQIPRHLPHFHLGYVFQIIFKNFTKSYWLLILQDRTSQFHEKNCEAFARTDSSGNGSENIRNNLRSMTLNFSREINVVHLKTWKEKSFSFYNSYHQKMTTVHPGKWQVCLGKWPRNGVVLCLEQLWLELVNHPVDRQFQRPLRLLYLVHLH